MPTIMVMLIMNVGRMLSIGYEKVLLMYTPSNSGVSDIIDTLVYRTGLHEPELLLRNGHWPVWRHHWSDSGFRLQRNQQKADGRKPVLSEAKR